MIQYSVKVSVSCLVVAFVALVFLFFCPRFIATAGELTVLASQHKYSPERQGNDEQTMLSGAAKQAVSPVHGKVGRKRHSLVSAASSRLLRRISAKCAVVLDGRTGQVLYEDDADLRRQPASTIKIITALIAIEKLDNQDKVIPSKRAANMPRSKVYLKPGSTYRANDLINAVLLASANDASVALAEKIGGSEKRFADMMNHKAKMLGARNTVCKTASGLTTSGQCSTARDLAVVFNRAMRNKEFANRMKHTKVTTSYGKTLWNHNKALWRIAGALGGKTGYTRAARQTYVGKFEKNGQELIVAIMGSETMWDDISRLVRYGFAKQTDRGKALPQQASVEVQLARLKSRLRAEGSKTLNEVQILSDNSKFNPNLSL